MKVAILILAHKAPRQVARLCWALQHPDIDCYLHIDLKSDIQPFRRLMPDVRYIAGRVDVRWGELSVVQSPLNGLREIRQSGRYDYVCLISGQDYPVVAPQQLLDELGSGKGAEYMDYVLLPEKGRSCYTNRVHYYHFYTKSPVVNKIMRKLTYKLCPFKRRYPTPDGRIYYGSNWWTLSGECVDYILNYCDEHPQYLAFHKRSFCSDEMFFQNIVLYSPFAAAVCPNRRYIDWGSKLPNPKTLLAEDYKKITESGAWFARKLDIDADVKLFDMLDQHRDADVIE